MGNFINDSGPNFKTGEVKLDPIPVYLYNKDFKKEFKAGNLKKDELAYRIASDVVKLLNMDGNVGFDFMRNEKEEAVLMDINPRITATVSVIAAGGVNLPYLRVKQLLGEKLPKCTPVYGTRIKRRSGEMFTTPNGELIDF